MTEPNLYHDVYKRFAKNFDVYDGDSFKADLDEGSYRWEIQRPFRIFGIDTPELAPLWKYYTRLDDTRMIEQRMTEKATARESRDRVKDYLEAAEGTVVVQTIKRPGKSVRDKYGRTLCRLLVPIGGVLVDVAKRLLGEAHARPYDGGAKGGAWTPLRPLGKSDPPVGAQ